MKSNIFNSVLGPKGGPVPQDLERAIRQACGRGRALQSALENRMAAALDYDFRGVRVHTGSEADEFCRRFTAAAFTVGKDLFFREGSYDPHSRAGQELIAHELIHVIQQDNVAARPCSAGMTVRASDDVLEVQADRIAKLALSNDQGASRVIFRVVKAEPVPGAALQIQRALAGQAHIDLPKVMGMGLGCHTAVWCWAAMEAWARGWTRGSGLPGPILERIGRRLTQGGQVEMLALARAGAWNFGTTKNTPEVGSVLLWPDSSTHVAVVSEPGQITGYNQTCIFPHMNDLGRTTYPWTTLANQNRPCFKILETTVVKAAVDLGLTSG